MATDSRWKQAQSYEAAHWQKLAEQIQAGEQDLSWYDWSAKHLLEILSKAFQGNQSSLESANILEVGSGPIGIVSFLKAKERYAIDPLNDFYSSQPSLIEKRNPKVNYQMARGEELVFKDDYFDLVIIDNVIDHVQNADGVMREIYRVLKPNAILFLTVNLHPAWGAFFHEIVSRLLIDKGHPHTFTISKIRQYLSKHGFDRTYDEWEDYKSCRKKDLASDSTKGKLKGISGLSEFLYTSVSTKKT